MRPDKNEYFIAMARLVATRSTCLRRSVGCVLTNARHHVIATGYNGVAAGMPHCNEGAHNKNPERRKLESGQFVVGPLITYLNKCEGADLPSGEGHDLCQAIHAEQNALLQCKDVYGIETCYATTFPCVPCVKLLMATSCKTIAYDEDHPHAEAASALWKAHGGLILRIPERP